MTSPVDTSVKFYSGDMAGAPVGFRGIVGSGLPVLQACLVDGFDTITLDSLIVSGGIATATFPTVHSAMPQSVVLIAGVTDKTPLNGEQKIITKVGNTVTFATAEANGTAAGTVTMKMAPLGWTRPYNGTNLAAFRAPDVDGTRMFLKVFDTAALDMRMIGYESMTAIATGTNLFPTAAQLSGGTFWTKSEQADATNNPWMLIGDGKRFYLAVATSYAGTLADGMMLYGFGDLSPLKATADPYAAFLSGGSQTAPWDWSLARQAVAGAMYCPRNHAGVIGAQAMDMVSSVGASAVSGQDSRFGSFPGLADALYLSCPLVGSAISTFGPRGKMAGLWHVPQALPSGAFAKNDLVNGAGETAGRKLLVVPAVGVTGIATNGAYATLLDVTGPW